MYVLTIFAPLGYVLLWAVESLVVLAVYFAPTIIAAKREHRDYWRIFAVNLFTGVTGVGWVAAFIWVIVSDPTSGQSATPPTRRDHEA